MEDEKVIWIRNLTFGKPHLEKHTDKTLMDRIERDFDFLGYLFQPEILSVADKTVLRFIKDRTARTWFGLCNMFGDGFNG